MKCLTIALSLGACLATAHAATAATRSIVVPRAGFGRALLAPARVDGKFAPTRSGAPALGLPERRPRLPVFSPVIGAGDFYGPPVFGTDMRPEPRPDLFPIVVFGSYDVTSFRADPPNSVERYVDRDGAAVLRTNSGPRIIYVPERQPKRRHVRMPSVIHGITLVTR